MFIMGHASPHAPFGNMDVAKTLQLVHQAVKRGAFDEVISQSTRGHHLIKAALSTSCMPYPRPWSSISAA